MDFRKVAPWAFALFLAAGCNHHSESKPANMAEAPAARKDCPDTFKVAGMEKGKATYHAEQIPGAVIIHADGENPTPGWQNGLTKSDIDVFPPEYTFNQKRPGGIALQVITPFGVCVQFKASQPVKEITIHDSAGDHKVKVDPAHD